MRKRSLYIMLILAVLLCGITPSFAIDNLEEWDSLQTYPQDVMGTKYLIPVKYFMDKKIITGDTDGLFYPDKGISRAEFATIMAKATNNADLVEIEALKKYDIFSDLNGYGWAKPYINSVSRSGLMKGKGGDIFAPGDSVTYAEIMTVIIRMSKSSASAAEGFAPKWPDNYILYAQTYNLTSDVEIKDWNAPAKKGDVVILLYRNISKN